MRFPLQLVPDNVACDFIGKRFISFAFSIIAILATIITLLTLKLNLGIDFTGGIIVEARSSQAHEISKFRDTLANIGYANSSIQNFGHEKDILIRLQPKVNEEQSKAVNQIKTALYQHVDSNIEFRRIDYVGPKVGNELITNGILALVFALLGILIYIALRFSWQYGVCAVVALLQNAWITLGFYSISQYEFDLSSIAAILTIIGYSINDTVVIFDRVRENLRKHKVKNLAELVNRSLNETLSRTIMTVSTTLIVCLILAIFGGEVIRGFSIAMFFGIAFGTYCSNFVAAPLLLYTGLKQETIA